MRYDKERKVCGKQRAGGCVGVAGRHESRHVNQCHGAYLQVNHEAMGDC